MPNIEIKNTDETWEKCKQAIVMIAEKELGLRKNLQEKNGLMRTR